MYTSVASAKPWYRGVDKRKVPASAFAARRYFSLFVCCVGLVASEDVACVDFLLYVVEAGVVAVGYDCLGLALEVVEVVDYFAAEEGCSVVEGGLVDDYFCSLGFYALHYALDGRLAEVVGVGLHGQAVYSYDAVLLF